MPKYIDADALLKEAKRLSGPQTGDGWDNWGVYALIERQPAVDAILVEWLKAQLTSGYHRLAAKTILEAWRYESREKEGEE